MLVWVKLVWFGLIYPSLPRCVEFLWFDYTKHSLFNADASSTCTSNSNIMPFSKDDSFIYYSMHFKDA